MLAARPGAGSLSLNLRFLDVVAASSDSDGTGLIAVRGGVFSGVVLEEGAPDSVSASNVGSS
jgi:hypothetical protein